MKKLHTMLLFIALIFILVSCTIGTSKTNEYNVNYYFENSLVTTLKVEEGKEVELNNYKIHIDELNCYMSEFISTKKGEKQSFDGWYSDLQCDNKIESKTVTEDINLYSRLIDIVYYYDIVFEVNDGTPLSKINVAENTIITQQELPVSTKEGYNFTGWYLDLNCKNKLEEYTIKSNIKLYAKWELITYKVSFETNNGIQIDDMIVLENETVNLKNINPEKSGYTFDGWYTDINLTDEFDLNTHINSDITLYAKWIKIPEYNISFVVNGGNDIQPINVLEGTKLEYLDEPIKEGYTFGGWYIDETLNTLFDYNKEITADLTLYAKWNEVIKYSDFSVHFLQLGNYNAGDCIYIKAGDADILIDGGSRESSLKSITNYINQYCKDGILEYVIVTHADQDHIACFAAENGLFDLYEVDTIIDFALSGKTTQVYEKYLIAREDEIEAGAKHYDANECVKGLNGAQKIYNITSDISFEVLEHKYYYTSNSDENNYSVCVMFRHVDSYFLFTGDLEEAGEKSLVELNNLPQVELFKAGHHGSKTSSNEQLLAMIKPKMVVVCCCAGTDEYSRLTDNQFPTQDFINRVAKYTDKIYIPSVAVSEVAVSTSTWGGVTKGEEYLKRTNYKAMNGDIVISSVAGIVSVKCSNNDIILKDSEWFNKVITLNGVTRTMRTWPSYGV